MSQGVYLDGGRELAQIRYKDPILGRFLERIYRAINFSASNLGAAPLGQLPPPPVVESTNVKGTFDSVHNTLTCPGEILHWVHTHNSALQRGIKYTTEIATDPAFTNAHPISIHDSRSGLSSLPTNDDSGNPVGYYLRVTAQLPGSAPTKPVVFGTTLGPTKILMTGTTKMTLLTSQGAGTEATGQHGQGLGTNVYRAPNGQPKRNLL